MKKQFKVLFFVAMLVMLVVVTMLMTSAALVAPDGIDPETGKDSDGKQYPIQVLDTDGTVVGYQEKLSLVKGCGVPAGGTVKLMCDLTTEYMFKPSGVETIGQSCTLDGNGFTAYRNVKWFSATKNNTLTIKNLRLVIDGMATASGGNFIFAAGGNAGVTSLIFEGENTVIFNANGLDYTVAGTKYDTIKGAVTNTEYTCGWIKGVTGGIVFNGTEEAHTTVHQIGHGGGIWVSGAAIDAKYLTITTMLEDGKTIGATHHAMIIFDSTNTTTSTFENCSFLSYAAGSACQNIRFFGSGTYNFINCIGNGFRVFAFEQGTGTVNIYGGKYTTVCYANETVPEDGVFTFITSSSVFCFRSYSKTDTALAFAGGLNIYGATFDNCDRLFRSEQGIEGVTPAIKVYGGTINLSGTNQLVYEQSYNPALDFMPVGSEYVNAAGATVTLDKATEINANGGRAPIYSNNNNYEVKITVGNGVVINLNKPGITLENLTKDTFTYGEVTINFAEGTVLPDVDEKFANCTFVVTGCPAEATLTGGVYDIDSVAKLFNVATASVRGDWQVGVHVKAFTFSGVEEGVIPLIIDGAIVNVTAGIYSDLATLFTLNSGELNISGGTFSAAAGEITVIKVNGGNLTITGNPCFTAADYTKNSDPSTGLIHVTGGTVVVSCTDTAHTLQDKDVNSIENAHFVINKNGVVFYINSANASVAVNSGVFFRKSDAVMPGSEATYSKATIFYFDGIFADDITTTLTINGGFYYANSLVRVYLVASSAGVGTREDPVTDAANLKNGVTITVVGGAYRSNAVSASVDAETAPIQIAAPGKHRIRFPEDSTFYGKANNYNIKAFFVTDRAKGIMGTTLDILGGEFEIARFFLNTSDDLSLVTANLKNISVIQTTDSNYFIAFMSGDSTLTIEKSTFVTEAKCFFVAEGTDAEIVINSGIFVTPRLIRALNNADSQTATIKLNGGTFVITGTYDTANGDSVFGGYNVTINEIVIAVHEGAVINSTVTLGQYASNVYYGELTLKGWAKFEASEGVTVPVLTNGAAYWSGTTEEGDAVTGIKFKSTITFESADEVLAFLENEKLVGFGHILAPVDYVAAAGAFTIDALEALSQNNGGVKTYHVINSLESGNFLGLDGDTDTISFAVALYNLNDNDRAYAAISYVCMYDDEGKEVYYYGAFDSTENARSANQLANK